MSEPKYAYRFCPCHGYDVEGIQTWLEDLAAEGLILTTEGAFAGFLTFTKEQPRHIRYRLEAIGKPGAETQEFHDIAAEFGWEYRCDYGAFQIFRSEDPLARELNTDPVIQAATVKRLTRQQIIEFLLAMAYLVLMSFLRHWDWFRFYYSAVAVGSVPTTLFILLLLLIPFAVIINLYHLHRLRRKLRHGLLDQRKAPGIWGWLRFLPGTLLVICLLFQFSSMSDVAPVHDVRDYPQDPPFITLSDIADPEDTAEYGTFMNDFYNRYAQFERSVAPVNIEWKELIEFTRPDGSTYSGHMILTYHETCGEWFAKGLADDYYAKERARYNEFQDLDVPDLGVDSIRVYSSYNLHVLIQHDNLVVEALISLNDGAVDPAWLRWAQAMADMLLNGGR